MSTKRKKKAPATRTIPARKRAASKGTARKAAGRRAPQKKLPATGKAKPARQPKGKQTLSPCLWFDDQAEEAAAFYVSVFRKAKLKRVTRYPAVGQEIHGRAPGSVMTVDFVLNGVEFTALNGGPLFRFNEAISLQVLCEDQEEIDYYWEKLGEGGDEKARQCGWLKDRFGLSWQVAPEGMQKMMKDPDSKATERVFAAMMEMKKLDIAALKKAWKGKS
jgi:predicted 3-demethylubiquinone-9 3-methyltransferase (glyoxalase superfamily)